MKIASPKNRKIFNGGAIFLFIIVIFVVVACSSCNNLTRCLRSNQAYIVGGDSQSRSKVDAAMRLANRRFQEMFGEAPMVGTILLDRAAFTPTEAALSSHWSLPIYLSREVVLSRTPVGFGSIGEDGASKAIDLTSMPSPLAHEICHKLVMSHPRKGKIPAAFEEIVAVGCEEKNFRYARMRDGAHLNLRGRWASFLVADHPLKSHNFKNSDDKFEKFQGVSTLEISTNTSLGIKIEDFYYKSAVLASYFEDNCDKKGVKTLFQFMKYSYNIEQWMKSSRHSCFKDGAFSFSGKVDRYIDDLEKSKN